MALPFRFVDTLNKHTFFPSACRHQGWIHLWGGGREQFAHYDGSEAGLRNVTKIRYQKMATPFK